MGFLPLKKRKQGLRRRARGDKNRGEREGDERKA
jgi:hypothetical protein